MSETGDIELNKIREKKMEELKRKMEYPKGPIEVTDANFAEIIGKYPCVVVDCGAAWCMPCKILEPVIDELSGQYNGSVVFGKLNVDDSREIAMKFGVMSIPTLLFFKDGKLVDQTLGAVPKGDIEGRLKKIL